MAHSQHNIDTQLVELFKEIENGFFIEAGAADGISQNNTLLLEKSLGWKGLLIEPNKFAFEICKYRRPSCIVENSALVSFDYTDDLIKGDFADQSFGGYMMGGCTNNHKKDSHAVARTLSDIIDQHNIKDITFLSIDVEGYEIEALSGIDYSRHSPDYILFEDHKHLGITYDIDYNLFFSERGFKQLKQFSNDHFLFKKEL